jgi:hypothetical protein
VPFKKYMLTGLMVWLPLAITIWVLSWLVKSLDGVLGGVLFGIAAVAPSSMGPAIGRLANIPGLGVLFVAAFMLVTGALVSNVAGRCQIHLQQCEEGVRHLVLEQWQCVSHCLVDPIPPCRELDDCFPDRYPNG